MIDPAASLTIGATMNFKFLWKKKRENVKWTVIHCATTINKLIVDKTSVLRIIQNTYEVIYRIGWIQAHAKECKGMITTINNFCKKTFNWGIRIIFVLSLKV